jgi:2-amino-4-hydroxy-6-hydroxymethyldihydropteridine diphosphokinase
MICKVKVAIALGANLGDREKMIRKAAERLGEVFLEEVKLSQLIETEPWGIKDQPKFLNAVMVGLSEWKPPAILNYLKSLERDLGRVTTVKNGPRVIDLDLICYGEEVWSGEGIEVPHPRMAERDFVLIPLVEVWPAWYHPIRKKTATQLLEEVQGKKD